jgi:hypothetical protein
LSKSTNFKVALVKSSYAALTTFNQAARTANATNDVDLLCICCQSVIPRNPPRHLLETNYFTNNLVGRVLDELTNPLRKLRLDETELVAMKAIIVLDPEAKGLSSAAVDALSLLRDRVQHALFLLISEKAPSIGLATARFGNLLLLLPALAKLSSVISENVQFAKMFGCEILDPFLIEIFVDFYTETIPAPTRERNHASTQTTAAAAAIFAASANNNNNNSNGLVSPPIYSPYLPYHTTGNQQQVGGNSHYQFPPPPASMNAATTYSAICFPAPNYGNGGNGAGTFFDCDPATSGGNFRIL